MNINKIMRSKKKILVIFVLAVALAVGIGSVYAYGSGFKHKKLGFSSEKHGMMTEKYEVMTEIFENNDYDAWKQFMDERVRKMSEWINEETFSKLVEMHELFQQGEYGQMKELYKGSESYPLWFGKGHFKYFHK